MSMAETNELEGLLWARLRRELGRLVDGFAGVAGAAVLASSSPQSPAELARRVASPGGMTQKGLDVLDNNGALERLVTLCLAAARDRAGVVMRTPLISSVE